MHVHHEVLQVLQLALRVVVVAQQFLDQLGLGLFERDVVGVAAEDVLEFALQLVDIVVVLASELEFDLFVLGCHSLLLLGALVEVFSKVFDDAVVMVTVLLPELVQLFLLGLGNLHDGLSHFQSVSNEGCEVGFIVVLLVDGEVALGLVESNVGGVNVVKFQEALLDISKGDGLLLIDGKSEDNSG